jgi:hypothetical protein
MDGLVYRSRYLPPKNTDFGKKKVYFEVEGNKVDYADIEVFYPSNATNHPPGGPKGFLIPLIDRCRQSVPELIETLEHELAHKRHVTAGILCRHRPYYQDIDGDGLDDSWEIRHGLHPCFINSVDPDIPDYEVIAYIEGYGKLLSAERFWEEDWADDCGHDPCRSMGNHRFGGINKGCPPSPFPWRYVRGTRVSSEPYHNDLLTEIPDLGR